MRKLQNKACYSIAVSNNYICIVGKTLNIYKKENFAHICCFNDSKNYSHAEFVNNNTIISKSSDASALVYKVYNIDEKACIFTIKIKNINESQQSHFILSPDKKFIFDVITVKLSDDVRFYKFNIETGESEYVKLGEDVRVIQNISYNQETDEVLVMHHGAAGMIDNELKCVSTITQINHYKMYCKDIYTKYTSISNGPILFFDNKYILYENMEIIDIQNKEIIGKVNYFYRRMQHGYFIKAYFSRDKKYLFFIYADRIIVFDCSRGEIFKEFKDDYCSHAEIIGDKIIIGTWSKAYMLDF